MRRDRMLHATSMLAIVVGFSAPAWAQQQAGTAPTDTTAPEPGTDGNVIIVTGTRGSLNEARNIERRQDGVANAITADDAGQFADQNVAESLQRLPGVSIERNEGEGRVVSIRGPDAACNHVTLNGVRLGATEKGDAAVALDILPADLLDQVVVTKTLTPDLDGDAIGGTIEIKTLSAFDRGDQLQARVETSYNEIVDKFSPKLSASFKRRFADDTIGLAIAGSYFDRKVQSDQLLNGEGLRCVRSGQTSNALAFANVTEQGCNNDQGFFLSPEEVDVRIKIGTRERVGGTVNLEWKPREDQLLFLRATHTRITDRDNRFQEESEYRRVTDRRDVRAAGPGTGTLDGVRFETQIFQQEIADRVWTASVGGETRLQEVWKLNLQGDWSRTTRESPGVRARFQARNGLSTYTADENSVDITYGPGIRRPTNTSFTPNAGSDPRVPSNLLFEQLFIDAETGEDEIYTLRSDLQRDLAGGRGFLKAGAKYRQRTKNADVDEFDFAARSAPLSRTETLASFQTFVPDNTKLPLYGAFPVLSELNTFLDQIRPAVAGQPGVFVNSNREDYESRERVLAGYAMGSLELSDGLRLVGGVRVERTRFRSDGNFVYDSDGSAFPDQTIALPTATKNFTEWLPSVVLRYDFSPTIVFRAAASRAIQRPNFEDTRNVQSALDDGDERSIDLQNPSLDPARALQFDASVAWYPNRNTGLTLGVFYKRITNFIVDTNLQNIDIRTIPGVDIPLPDAIPGGFVFNDVEVALNGDVGTIYGVEFAYSQSYTFLPRPLNGLFTSVSATWVKSKARIDVREGTFAFPDQPKWVLNGSLGYEDKRFSLRGSATYRSENVDSIASVSPLDEIRAAYLSFDLNARFNVTRGIQLYADAINLSDERDEVSYRGDRNGGFFSEIERYGRTFQLGVRATF